MQISFNPQHTMLRNFALLILVFWTTAVSAQDISFDYVQATFTGSTIDLSASPSDIEGNGIGFSLSLSFDPHYAITLDVLATTFDSYQDLPVETIKTQNLGITAHTDIADDTAIFGNASLLLIKVTANDGLNKSTDNDISYELRFGLRHLLNKSFELEAGINHFYAFDYGTNTANIELRYQVRKPFAVGFAYKFGDNKDSLSLNGRMSF